MNTWKVEFLDYQNRPELEKTKIVNGTWDEVCRMYNPEYKNDVKIKPMEFGVKKQETKINVNMEEIKRITLEKIANDYSREIGRLNNEIIECAKNGENMLNLYDIELENVEQIKYYYTNLGFSMAFVEGHLRIRW